MGQGGRNSRGPVSLSRICILSRRPGNAPPRMRYVRRARQGTAFRSPEGQYSLNSSLFSCSLFPGLWGKEEPQGPQGCLDFGRVGCSGWG